MTILYLISFRFSVVRIRPSAVRMMQLIGKRDTLKAEGNLTFKIYLASFNE